MCDLTNLILFLLHAQEGLEERVSLRTLINLGQSFKRHLGTNGILGPLGGILLSKIQNLDLSGVKNQAGLIKEKKSGRLPVKLNLRMSFML